MIKLPEIGRIHKLLRLIKLILIKHLVVATNKRNRYFVSDQ